MNDKKPMIRHCYNCKWCGYTGGVFSAIKYCTVKYEKVGKGRIEALLCRHFKMKEVQDETNK